MSRAIVASLVGIGGIGGGLGAYKLYSSSKEKTISTSTIADRLRAEKFSPLGTNSTDEANWTKIKEAYEKVKSDQTKVFSESGELKDLCRTALAKLETDSDYLKAKKWCVVPISLSSHLDKLGFKSLSSQDNDQNPDKTKWENIVTEHKKSENQDKRISDLGDLNTDGWKTIMKKCKEIGEKQNYDDEFTNNFEKYKKWCSEKKAN
ncbi:hypothetical protein MHC_03570 [Mycoplasma haemocanis str. Illinois]|uniref:Uncharacterized protein n=1 Tax=Mycoplasma haemocanis (strain Illinois) TaxID=1111676 RepID=H6N7F2_MYCHN|nr:hypothetical protein [Mycoplasma haemocanis]AEW45574.1 hypothetical protein MHC_03570 [Mycoplasma haemocanis str. Illinois]